MGSKRVLSWWFFFFLLSCKTDPLKLTKSACVHRTAPLMFLTRVTHIINSQAKIRDISRISGFLVGSPPPLYKDSNSQLRLSALVMPPVLKRYLRGLIPDTEVESPLCLTLHPRLSWRWPTRKLPRLWSSTTKKSLRWSTARSYSFGCLPDTRSCSWRYSILSLSHSITPLACQWCLGKKTLENNEKLSHCSRRLSLRSGNYNRAGEALIGRREGGSGKSWVREEYNQYIYMKFPINQLYV